MKLLIYLLSVIGIVSACGESELTLSQQQAVVAGNVKVESELSEAGKQRMEQTLGYHSVELVGNVSNPDGVEISSYGVLLSEVPYFSLSQAVEYVGESLGGVEGFSENDYLVKLGGLKDEVTYYFRFFVKHAKGISYSEYMEENTFKTVKHPRVPETKILTEDYIDILEVKANIEHDGHFAVTECGIYFGLSEDALNTKLKASNVPVIVDHQGEYAVSMGGYGLNVGDFFYCQPYAINEKGEGKGEIVKLKVEKAKAYAKLEIVDRKVYRNKVVLSVTVSSVGDHYMKEYGYYDTNTGNRHVIANNLTEQTSPKKGDNLEVVFDNLKMGEKHSIYMYAVNAEDEESLEPDEYYEFMAGIQGKNEDDKDIIYLELNPIESNGKKYYILDRNLGASGVYETGSAPEKPEDLGWLLQHGRKADGHQLYNSKVVQKAASGGSFQTLEEAGNYVDFIGNSTSWAWLNPNVHESEKLWTDSEDGGKHNPCPIGYRIPIKSELNLMNEHKDQLKFGTNYRWRTASSGAYQNDGNGYFWGIDRTLLTPQGGAKYAVLILKTDPNVITGFGEVQMGQGCYIRCLRVE